MVTYGTEVMPESTLGASTGGSPRRLLQTYGLSEVGILRSQSKSADSLWIKWRGWIRDAVVDGLSRSEPVGDAGL